MISKDNIRMSVKFTKEHYNKIRQLATASGVSISKYISQIVIQHLEENSNLEENSKSKQGDY